MWVDLEFWLKIEESILIEALDQEFSDCVYSFCTQIDVGKRHLPFLKGISTVHWKTKVMKNCLPKGKLSRKKKKINQNKKGSFLCYGWRRVWSAQNKNPIAFPRQFHRCKEPERHRSLTVQSQIDANCREERICHARKTQWQNSCHSAVFLNFSFFLRGRPQKVLEGTTSYLSIKSDLRSNKIQNGIDQLCAPMKIIWKVAWMSIPPGE